MLNVNMNLECVRSLKENYAATEKEVEMLELFVNGRDGWTSLNDITDDKIITDRSQVKSEGDFDKLLTMIDLNDFFLRVREDEAVVEVDYDDACEELLRKLYKCSSRNEYDLQLLFDNLDREAFVKRCIDEQCVRGLLDYSDNGLFLNTYALD